MDLLDPIVVYALVRRRRPKRNYWVHPMNLRRDQWGEHLKLEEMYNKYPDKFHQYTRMSPPQFDKVLELISSKIHKIDTNWRKSLSPKFRLFVTLR